MKAAATLSRDFRISIPRAVREKLKWQAGQKLVLVPKGKGLLVMPPPDLGDLTGMGMKRWAHGQSVGTLGLEPGSRSVFPVKMSKKRGRRRGSGGKWSSTAEEEDVHAENAK